MELSPSKTLPLIKKPLWIQGEALLWQNFILQENNSTVNSEDTVHKDINAPEPLWLAGEKLLCQKFFIHNLYIHTYSEDTVKPEKQPKKKKKSRIRPSRQERYELFISEGNRKKNIQETREIHRIFTRQYYNQKHQMNNNNSIYDSSGSTQGSSTNGEPSYEYLNRNNSRQNQQLSGDYSREPTPLPSNSFPTPGNATRSLITLLDYFSCGMEELFPNNRMSDKLSTHISASDSIHMMAKLHSVLSQLDKILENRVTDYIDRNDIDVSLLTSRGDVINEIRKTYIRRHLNNASPKVESNLSKTPNKMKTMKMISNSKWSVDPYLVSIYETEHKIQFINNTKYLCRLCGRIYFNNPASHIISPTHINALSDTP